MKLSRDRKPHHAAPVRPRAGAWIETPPTMRTCVMPVFALARGRGLKLDYDGDLARLPKFALARGRGLKLRARQVDGSRERSPSRGGVD